jgi:hypothetical protein
VEKSWTLDFLKIILEFKEIYTGLEFKEIYTG